MSTRNNILSDNPELIKLALVYLRNEHTMGEYLLREESLVYIRMLVYPFNWCRCVLKSNYPTGESFFVARHDGELLRPLVKLSHFPLYFPETMLTEIKFERIMQWKNM